MPLRAERLADEREHARELREHEDAVAARELVVEQLEQRVELRRVAPRRARRSSRRGADRSTPAAASSARRGSGSSTPRGPSRGSPCGRRRARRRGCLVELALLAAQLDGDASAPSSAAAPSRRRASCGAGRTARRPRAARRGARRRPAARWAAARSGGSDSSSPSRPGVRKSKSDHSSPRWFSTGVPVRHRRCSAGTRSTARRAWLRAFLIACASSSTTRWKRCSAKRSSSRTSDRIRRDDDVAPAATSAQRACRSGPCRTRTRRRGANRASSRAQLPTSLVGATTSAGASSRPSAFSTSTCAIVCSVLPRPMSSARTPPTPASRRCWRNATPSSWYGRSVAWSPAGGSTGAGRRAGRARAR